MTAILPLEQLKEVINYAESLDFKSTLSLEGNARFVKNFKHIKEVSVFYDVLNDEAHVYIMWDQCAATSSDLVEFLKILNQAQEIIWRLESGSEGIGSEI